eukprot:2913619-Pleurochrysis_carterae.AAC.1
MCEVNRGTVQESAVLLTPPWQWAVSAAAHLAPFARFRCCWLCALSFFSFVRRVKRSTADGVEIMRGYFDTDTSPEVEDWLPPEKWSFSKVFDDINRWTFSDTVKTPKYRRQWQALKAWHSAYSTSDSIAVGMMQDVCAEDSLQLGGCPAVSWSAMREMLDSRAVGFRENAPAGAARSSDTVPSATCSSSGAQSAPAAAAPTAPTAPPLKKSMSCNTTCYKRDT